eukprot:SAG22_NODE_18624_length_284_cov_0.708108_1_plen_69_part_10
MAGTRKGSPLSAAALGLHELASSVARLMLMLVVLYLILTEIHTALYAYTRPQWHTENSCLPLSRDMEPR